VAAVDGDGGDIGCQNDPETRYHVYDARSKTHFGNGKDPAIGSAAVVGRDAATYYLRAEDSELDVFI